MDCEEVEEFFIKGDEELKRVHGIIIGNDNFNGNGNDNGNNGEYFDIEVVRKRAGGLCFRDQRGISDKGLYRSRT